MNNNIIYCIIALVIILFVFYYSSKKSTSEYFSSSNKEHVSCPLAEYQENVNEFGTATAKSHLQERANKIKKAVANCEKSDCPLSDMQKNIWNFHEHSGAHASTSGVITGVETGLGYASPESI